MSERVTWIEIKKDEKNSPYCHRDCSMWYERKGEAINKYHIDSATTEVVNIYNYKTEKMELMEFKTRDERIRWLDNPPFEYQYKPGTKVAPEDIGIPKECADKNNIPLEQVGPWDKLIDFEMVGYDSKTGKYDLVPHIRSGASHE